MAVRSGHPRCHADVDTLCTRVRKKRGLLEKGSFQKIHRLENLEALEILETLENPPTMENKGEWAHFLEIVENLEILEILEIHPFRNDPFFGPLLKPAQYLRVGSVLSG